MLKELKKAINDLPELIKNTDQWGSQFIDYDNPYVHRMYLDQGDITVNMHMFTPTNSEIVWHPHPWPAAFMIAKGGYELQLGLSEDGETPPEPIGPVIMTTGSFYQMASQYEWHSVRPLDYTFTFSVQGPEFDVDWSFETDDRKAFRDLTEDEKEPLITHFSDKSVQKMMKESIALYKPNKKGMYSFEVELGRMA
jgi:hypothetical protein